MRFTYQPLILSTTHNWLTSDRVAPSLSPSQKLHKLHGPSSGLLSATPIYWLALLILRRKAKEKASLHAVETFSQEKGTVQKLSCYAGRSTPAKNAIYFFIRGVTTSFIQIPEREVLKWLKL